MKNILLLFCFLLISIPCGATENPNANLEVNIKKFGINSDTIKKDMASMTENPSLSVSLLINELHPIPEKRILPQEQEKHKSSMHVIWCIRALRCLTGLDFKNETIEHFGKNELEQDRHYWLFRECEIPFFAVWMSRDSIYIAPKDAQEKIIAKWREWFNKNGQTHKYLTDKVENYNDWYF